MAMQFPLTIIHGENNVKSREALFQAMAAARATGAQLTRLDSKALEVSQLELAVSATSLFAEPKVVVIEDLLVGPKSKRRDSIVEWLATWAGRAAAESDASTQLIWWEKRAIPAGTLKKFAPPLAQVQEFKLTKSLFVWLDSFTGNATSTQRQRTLRLMEEAVAQDGDMMCYLMLIRQVRMLLPAKDGSLTGGPPFIVAKIKKQAGSFTLAQLLRLHQRLLEMDLEMKSTKSPLSLAEQLAVLQTSVYSKA